MKPYNYSYHLERFYKIIFRIINKNENDKTHKFGEGSHIFQNNILEFNQFN